MFLFTKILPTLSFMISQLSFTQSSSNNLQVHDDVIKWKHFPRYWPFVRGIQRSPVNSPHKGQWRGALMFTLICARINGWVNNGEAGDLRRNRAHYDVIVIFTTEQSGSYRTPRDIVEKHCSLAPTTTNVFQHIPDELISLHFVRTLYGGLDEMQ